MKIQDAGPNRKNGQIPVYHTHGLRQWYGTCKIHKDLNCPHLVHWRQGRGLGKTIMREWWNSYDDIYVGFRCKTCWC